MAEFDCDQRVNRETLRACYDAHPSLQEFHYCVVRWLNVQDAKAAAHRKANAPKKKRGVMDRLRGAA